MLLIENLTLISVKDSPDDIAPLNYESVRMTSKLNKADMQTYPGIKEFVRGVKPVWDFIYWRMKITCFMTATSIQKIVPSPFPN